MENTYNSAVYTEALAEELREVAPEEMLKKAEKFREAMNLYKQCGEYADAQERAAACSVRVASLCENALRVNAEAQKRGRRRHVLEILCLILPVFIIILIPATIVVNKLPLTEGLPYTKYLLVLMWAVVIICSVVVITFLSVLRGKENKM